MSVHRDRQFTLFLVMIGYGRAIAINAFSRMRSGYGSVINLVLYRAPPK
ncbi:hypothetical protein [Tychonema sp. BBK16]|nr:hypothetical protein [Tychonema sp. BBK16]MCF6371867.1 hypothetical protein [Tychonema sp. BBK16]